MAEFQYKTAPYRHQRAVFEASRDRPYYALLMEMGTGKSKIICDTAAYLFGAGKIDAMAIFANKGSYANWALQEIPTHLPDWVPRNVVLWRGSTVSERVTREYASLGGRRGYLLQVLVMNIEALAYRSGEEFAVQFARSHRTLAVIDESTTIKNHKAARTRAAMRVGAVSVARRILTGSAVANRPLDIYSQCEFLEHGCLGYTSYYAFRAAYAEMSEIRLRATGRTVRVVTGYRQLDRLTNSLRQFAAIVKKEDCLDLPPKIYERYAVDMTPEQSLLYHELRRNSVAELGAETYVTARVVLTKLLRLHQLVCGHLTDDSGAIHEVPHNRLAALEAVLEEAGHKVVIWATYRADVLAIAARLREVYGDAAVATYYGDTPAAERPEIVRRYQQDSELRYLVANPQTGGYGITLTAAADVVYYSNTFDAELRRQSEDRLHRLGQTRAVTYVDLYSPGTVDEAVLAALARKQSLSEEVLRSTWRDLLGANNV